MHRHPIRKSSSALEGTNLFKALTLRPPSDNISSCIKYYQHVEAPLKKWCQLKATSNLTDQTLEVWDRLLPCIESLMTVALKIFELDPNYYLSKEIDSRIWKYGIYHFITVLRIEGALCSDIRNEALKQILERGLQHYEELLKIRVPDVLKIQLDPIFSRSCLLRTYDSAKSCSPEEQLVYRLFIYMGDLYRYRFQIDGNIRSVRMASSMYNGARLCDTRKSRAYYQLGLICKTQTDLIGIIYNFTRAWHVENPADGARQQLQLIYGDVAQWYLKRKCQFWFTRVKIADKMYTREWQTRFNIWIADATAPYENGLPKPVVPPSRMEHLNSLSDSDVFARFSLAYTHFLGILYTNIGTEGLEHVAKDFIVYFEGLVMYKEYPYSKLNWLLQVFGMILFIIDHLKPPKPTRDNAPLIAQKTYLRNVAINASLDMFIIAAEKIMEVILTHQWKDPMFIPCTAAIHVWCNWLMRRNKVFLELKQRLDCQLSTSQHDEKDDRTNFLSTSFHLHIIVSKMFERYPTVFPTLWIKSKGTNTKPLKMLPEQMTLDGFAEVLLDEDIGTSYLHVTKDSQDEEALLSYRFLKILKFTSILFEKVQSKESAEHLADYEPVECIYQREFQIMNTVYDKKKLLCKTKFTRRRPDCNNARVIVTPAKTPQSAVAQGEGLEQHELLHALEKISLSETHAIFCELSQMGVRTEMVIKPVRAVLDTNIFIRKLKWIETLMYSLPYPLIIPTTVLLELRGLAKGAKTGETRRSSPKQLTREELKFRTQEIMQVGEMCLLALDFLDQNKKYFKVVTIDGKEVKMYKYKTQKVFDKRFDKNVRNDEKILETCCQLEDQDQIARAQDHPLRIYRNTVLLTEDRSLRVRALAQDIPARDIEPFTDWLMASKTPSTVSKRSPFPRRKNSQRN